MKFTFAVVVLALCAFVQPAQMTGQSTSREIGKGKITYKSYRVKSYSFTNVTPAQQELLDRREKIQKLIIQTYDDDVNGVIDVAKYQEIKRLAEELPGPPAKKKRFLQKIFGVH